MRIDDGRTVQVLTVRACDGGTEQGQSPLQIHLQSNFRQRSELGEDELEASKKASEDDCLGKMEASRTRHHQVVCFHALKIFRVVAMRS